MSLIARLEQLPEPSADFEPSRLAPLLEAVGLARAEIRAILAPKPSFADRRAVALSAIYWHPLTRTAHPDSPEGRLRDFAEACAALIEARRERAAPEPSASLAELTRRADALYPDSGLSLLGALRAEGCGWAGPDLVLELAEPSDLLLRDGLSLRLRSPSRVEGFWPLESPRSGELGARRFALLPPAPGERRPPGDLGPMLALPARGSKRLARLGRLRLGALRSVPAPGSRLRGARWDYGAQATRWEIASAGANRPRLLLDFDIDGFALAVECESIDAMGPHALLSLREARELAELALAPGEPARPARSRAL